MMSITGDLSKLNFDAIPIDPFWNLGESDELKMHRIHAYPAKFPAFIATKAFEYARKNSLQVKSVADIFCGCGTVALEAKRNGVDFWGCDINPVATMIAKVKSRRYQNGRLERYYRRIVNLYMQSDRVSTYNEANERLRYWYDQEHYDNLFNLKKAIKEGTPDNSSYQLFFMCAFSNILKATSRWLAKSIKPTIDKNKKPADVLKAFKSQVKLMFAANSENKSKTKSKTEIITANFLSLSTNLPKVDMIVTSPPYVTSYEYADIHQLSALWLDFASDFRELRKGSIGSRYQNYDLDQELKLLNTTGTEIATKLLTRADRSEVRSVAKYFFDMQQVAVLCYSMLVNEGIALFVIGNTEYRGVKIDNVRHLVESLRNAGFKQISVTKRKISNKILTPYRDATGRFTTDDKGRKVYSEEFIVLCKKIS